MKHPVLIPFTAVWFLLLFVLLLIARTVLPLRKAEQPQQIDDQTDWFQL